MKTAKRYAPITIALIGAVIFLIGGVIEYPRLAAVGAGVFVFAIALAAVIFRKKN